MTNGPSTMNERQWERLRTESPPSFLGSSGCISSPPQAPTHETMYRDSHETSRLTEEEANEIIQEGASIRTRMERHRVDVEYVLQCNTMLLEWVAMRERLLQQWYRVPGELVFEPNSTFPSTPHSPSPTPCSPDGSKARGLRSRQTSLSSLPSLPSLGALLQRKLARPKDHPLEVSESSTKNGRNGFSGLAKRMKHRRKECSCVCTCGSAPSTALKFDDDAVVVLDLHAELIKYDELLRNLKERLDGQEAEKPAEKEEYQTETEAEAQPELADDDYEADEESVSSTGPQPEPEPAWPAPRSWAHSEHPWRIPEVSEPPTDGENESDTDDGINEEYLAHSRYLEETDTSSAGTATPPATLPGTQSTPSTFVMDEHGQTLSSGDTHKTLGVLSTLMEMEARSIVGSDRTGDTFGHRSFVSSTGEFGSLYGAALRSFPMDSLGNVDPDISVLLDRILVRDECSVSPATLSRSTTPTAAQPPNRREELHRALGAGRGVRVQDRRVTEFGVRRGTINPPTLLPPYSSPAVSDHSLHRPSSTPQFGYGSGSSLTFGTLGHSVESLSESLPEHSHEQFADASVVQP